MSKKLKISFDVDGTLLDSEVIQQIAYELKKYKNVYELFITTRRYSNQKNECLQVYSLADMFDIPESNVFFTNRDYKYKTLYYNFIDIHIDDDPYEVLLTPIGKKNIIYCYKNGIIGNKYEEIMTIIKKLLNENT